MHADEESGRRGSVPTSLTALKVGDVLSRSERRLCAMRRCRSSQRPMAEPTRSSRFAPRKNGPGAFLWGEGPLCAHDTRRPRAESSLAPLDGLATAANERVRVRSRPTRPLSTRQRPPRPRIVLPLDRQLYLIRWGIEQVFQQVTKVFMLSELIGTTPEGTIFQL
jgi:hypothetical protein